ncbi:carbohydrate ABC transporter permease [Bacillus sp. OTU2372]|uniref:carbohydrate ABC transporter permease n=2 Tax=Bacillaceae TaxID=186817 RepID=UPI00313D7161
MKKKNTSSEKREARLFYLYTSPFILGFLIFTLYPAVYSIILIFTNADMTGTGEFVGLSNIKKAFTQDPLFYKSLLNTLYYVIVSVPLSLILSFLVALLLNHKKIKGMGIFRTTFYIPYITAGVAVTLLWGWIFNAQFGLINYVLSFFGITGPNWLSDGKWAMPAIIIMGLWTIGNSIIITLAGLQDIPEQLYESASIDGANRLIMITHITLPLSTPTLFFNLVMGIIGGFQVFMQPFVLTEGGPNYATYTYMMHIYNSAFKYGEMGYASTLAWILFIVILIITLIVNRTSKYWVYYEN